MTTIQELGYEELTGPQVVHRLGEQGILQLPETLDGRAPYLHIGGQVVDAVREFPTALSLSRLSDRADMSGTRAIIALEYLGALSMPRSLEERGDYLRIGGQVFEAMRTEGVN